MYKQCIIIRKDLGMSPGKLASQACHASIAFLTNIMRDKDNITEDSDCYRFSCSLDKGLYEEWICGEFTKVVLQARNKNHLLKAKAMAEELGMLEGKDFFLIRDNCHTELVPEEDGRTLTCIGFKPMPSELIDKITRKYHLYT